MKTVSRLLGAALALVVASTTLSAMAAGNRETKIMHGVLRVPRHRPAALGGNPFLLYYGGRVMSNAQIVAVFWGPDVDPEIVSRIGGFYDAIVKSAHLDWLSEYDTAGRTGSDGDPGTNQHIGRGAFVGAYPIAPSVLGPEVTDDQIQAELAAQIAAGHLPAPVTDVWGYVDTIYMIHFPPGLTTVDSGGARSCVEFCAYHGTTNVQGKATPYAVLPDLGGGCDGACGTAPAKFDNQTAVASHELVESITDPDVGFAEIVARPLAWYDTDFGEIGDICNGDQGTFGGYTVQQEWSNVYGACLVVATAGPDDFGVTLAPWNPAVAPGSATTVAVETYAVRGAAETLSLAVAGLPPGVTATFAPATVTTGGTSTLTLTAAKDAAPTAATITVTVTGGAASHAATGTLTVTPPDGFGGTLRNGTFETGTLDGWTPSGAASLTSDVHGGSFAARLGGPDPSGDSTLAQSFLLPAGAGQLSFWVKVACLDTVAFDWATATLRDEVTGAVSTVLPRTCTNGGSWQNVVASVGASAGHRVTLTFANHDDGRTGDATMSEWDDVRVSAANTPGTPPLQVAITAPAAGATVAGLVPVSAVASARATRIEVSVDGALAAASNFAGALSFYWNTSGVPNGTHTLAARAFDAAGNAWSSPPLGLTVANTAGGLRQLLGNGDFEAGSIPAPWVATPGVVDSSPSSPAHSGSWKARLDGSGAPRTDTLAQTVTLPADARRGTFSFWLRIATQETTHATPYDMLQLQVRDASGTTLQTLGAWSNLDAADWKLVSFDVSAFVGRTIEVYFVGTEDSSLATSFSVDDARLDVQ